MMKTKMTMMMNELMKRIISILLICFLELNLCFSAAYSGTTYNRKKSIPTTYSGIELEPIEYNGELLYPLSYHGTVIAGIYYEGIDLTNYKITTLTITGNETDSDIFNENVPAEYRVNWKKVLGKYSIGTTIIVITGIISLCSGTVPLATAGYIAAGAFNGAITGSVIGAATDAFFSATLAFFKGEPKQKIFKEAIEASADGFMIGALTGAIVGGGKSLKELSKGKVLLNSKGKAQFILDNNGLVYNPKGGDPCGRIFDYKTKHNEYAFFIDQNDNLYNLDNKLVSKNFYFKKNGLLIDNSTNKRLAYVDTNDILTFGDDIEKVINKDIRHVKDVHKIEKLAGTVHPDVNVHYEWKVVVDADGVQWKGVFPKFKSSFTVQLPEEYFYKTDDKQFEYCNKLLREQLKKNPKLRKLFTDEQLKPLELKKIKTPEGFTWHHNEELGKMELIDTKTHNIAKHVGGKSIWGGGKALR